jgi:uncharacterized protein
MGKRRWILATVAGLAVLLLAGRVIAGVYAEWSWYAAMGALPIYQSKLFNEGALRGAAGILGFAFAFANLYTVRRSIVSLVLPRRLANIDFGEEVPGRRLTGLVLMLSVGMAVLLTIPQDDWVTLALARLGLPFGERDPYQDRDFGFYLYNLPFERSIHLWAVLALTIVGAVVIFLYAITPSLRWDHGRLHVSTYVRRHLSVLGALVLLLVGWSYRLDGITLLTSGSGADGAFTAFDDKLLGPLLTGLSIAASASAFAVLWLAWHGLRNIALSIFVLVILAGPISRAVFPLLDRWATSDAERVARERPYQSTRIQFTRRAFGVDQVVDADSAHVPPMTRAEAARGVSNWDVAMIARTAELAHRDLTTIATLWTPTTAGLTAATVQRSALGTGTAVVTTIDVATADEQGRAFLHLAEPPDPDEAIPSVLVEPGGTAPMVVADSTADLAAPPFASWKERIAHAWNLRNPRLLASDVPEPRPRILFHREVRERIGAIAPFFTIGPTLQAVLVADSLYWLAELFVTSDEYPLARPLPFAGGERQYVRHAATAVVQAHTGRVFIVADRLPDPITRTWMRRFPWLFVSRDVLPSGLGATWPPPVDRASVQGEAIARAGFPGDTVTPSRVAAVKESFVESRESSPRLYAQHGTAGPLTASIAVLESSDRMVGVLLARGGSEPRVEWHRVASQIPWRGVLDELWAGAKRAGLYGAKRGADRRGQVQLLPFTEGFAFAQSFYTWPTDGPPALRGVVVLDGGETHAGATLSEALGVSRPTPGGVTAALRTRITALYEEMSAAMRRGDWKAFGDAYASLGRLLRAAR